MQGNHHSITKEQNYNMYLHSNPLKLFPQDLNYFIYILKVFSLKSFPTGTYIPTVVSLIVTYNSNVETQDRLYQQAERYGVTCECLE